MPPLTDAELQKLQDLVSCGARVAALRYGLHLSTGPIAEVEVGSELGSLRHSARWSRAELSLARNLARGHALTDCLPARPSDGQALEPGRVNVLTAGTGSLGGIGVAVPLTVVATPRGGEIWAVAGVKTWDASSEGAFRSGVYAAMGLLAAGGGFVRHVVLSSYGLIPKFDGVGLPVKGESLGLAGAVAVLSAVTRAPVPGDVGFSGRIGVDGTVGAVGGVAAKLRGASDRGLRRLFLPSETRTEAHVALARQLSLKVHWVQHLAEVTAKLGLRLEATQQRLDRTTIHKEVAKRHWMKDAPPSDRRILVTVLGKSDPIGVWKDQHGQPIKQADGPVLTICRHLRPTDLYCLFTTVQGEVDNDYSAKFRRTRTILSQTGIKVHPLPLKGISDPTDLESLYPAFLHVVQRLGARGTLYINVTSGTGQMMVAWHFLAERLRHHGQRLTLLQAREARWAKGDAQVRAVALPLP